MTAVKVKEGRPREVNAGDDRTAAGTLADTLAVVSATLVVLSTLALVGYLVVTMRSDTPTALAEVIAAASSLLAAAAAVLRATRSR
jgi:hypothetical protein